MNVWRISSRKETCLSIKILAHFSLKRLKHIADERLKIKIGMGPDARLLLGIVL